MYITSIRLLHFSYIGVLLHEIRIETVCIKPQNRGSAQKRLVGKIEIFISDLRVPQSSLGHICDSELQSIVMQIYIVVVAH